jgi:hypothetical protein
VTLQQAGPEKGRLEDGMSGGLCGVVWRTLKNTERKRLLKVAYPDRSKVLLDLEAAREWNDLLPSTRDDLVNHVDWNTTLGRPKA